MSMSAPRPCRRPVALFLLALVPAVAVAAKPPRSPQQASARQLIEQAEAAIEADTVKRARAK